MPARELPERIGDQVEEGTPLPLSNAHVHPPSGTPDRVHDTIATPTMRDPMPRPASAPPNIGRTDLTSFIPPSNSQNNLRIQLPSMGPMSDTQVSNPPTSLLSGVHISESEVPIADFSTTPTVHGPVSVLQPPPLSNGQATTAGWGSGLAPSTRAWADSNPTFPSPTVHDAPDPSLVPGSAISRDNNTAAVTGPLANVQDVPPNASLVSNLDPLTMLNEPHPDHWLVPASLIEVSPIPDGTQSITEDGWKCLKGFIEVLDNAPSAFGLLKMVMDDLIRCIETHDGALAARQDYSRLKTEFESLFSELSNYFSGDAPPALTASMDNLRCAIHREVDHISTREERRGGREGYEAEDLDEMMECYGRIHEHLKRLKLNANPSKWKIEDKQVAEAQLDKLAASMPACYDSAEADLVRRRECTPGTREEVLANLDIWRRNKNQGNLYWLNGMAGTGKTTIANSLCVMLDQSHELGASFFCSRLLPECRDVKLIIPTIAYQLARFSRPFRSALSNILERHPDIRTKSLSKQLQRLVVEPLREVTQALPTHLVVVMDALDECGDSRGIGQLLEMLARDERELPIKVFVSSRPEPQIRNKIGNVTDQLILHQLVESSVKRDIRRYLLAEVSDISLSEPQLVALVKRAGVLFIYAAAIVRYITVGEFLTNRRKRLEVLLGATPTVPSKVNVEIDALYHGVLGSAFNDPDLEDTDGERMKLVLDTVICAQAPLTVGALTGLLQLADADWVLTALSSLWSVIRISGANSLVTTLHTSFPDFMLSSERSDPHTCRAETHHGRLAELCLKRIEKNECQFNICGLESSYVVDEQVPDLEDRVKQAIPQDLWYACRYWAVHLELSGQSSKRVQLLRDFLSKRLLLWMEVLNLKKHISIGASLLQKARGWCNRGDSAQETKDLIHEAWRFVTIFAMNTVSRSTPHIYVSMMASWPRPGPLADCYIPRTRGLAEVGGTGMNRRWLGLLCVVAVGNQVNSVAVSPDGTRIASASIDRSIRVWSARSGKQVIGPLQGHTSLVSSLAFSPDGMRIVSGSHDKTVCVWDLQSRPQMLEPLRGHTDWVETVAFSPEGMHIASGSSDNTLIVWDVRNGQQVLGPLRGHADVVSSVAFSPNGMRIVSGSWDRTICIWDVQSGQQVLGPLQGHANMINSVAFSPDGTRIVSGSHDYTICVWDVERGRRELGPLKVHTRSVNSASFSPDGLRIVTGSDDETICMWDAQSGQQLLAPLTGHTSSVKSVVFSPDGTRIVSGSSDKTVCVWDAHSSQQMLGPLKGHTKLVSSIALSPDGMRIVSGSWDRTICIWDVQSGQQVLGPLQGHANMINSVAFSPDGTRIVSGSHDYTICVWDVESGRRELGPLKVHTRSVNSASFSPDGLRIVTGSDDETICVWDAQSGQQVLAPLTGHTSSVKSVVFSPSGIHIVSGSDDITIRVWDVRSGQQVLRPLTGHHSCISSVAFSPDGTHIVSGSWDQTICVWDAQSGQKVLGPLRGHTGVVHSIAFSADGMHIFSASTNETICVWDVQSGQRVFELLTWNAGQVNSVAFSPDGMRIVSGSGSTANAIRVWLPQSDSFVPNRASRLHSTLLPSWVLAKDGWVINQNQQFLLWVPPDLRNRLLDSCTAVLISTEGSVQLNFSDAKTGTSWVDCYVPA